MLRGSPSDQPDALTRFVQRFREDAGFHELARNDIRSALAQAGLAVPHGVTVSFASTPAQALSMTLDRNAEVPETHSVLDDSELLDVVGGAGAPASIEQAERFLGLLIRSKA